MKTKNKLMTTIVSILLSMSLVVPTYADNTYTDASSGQVEVNLEVTSSYSVALPATINLTKAVDPGDASNQLYYDNSTANDEVAVYGNIADNEYITVTPASTVDLTMQRTAGSNLQTTVNVTQTIKEWANASAPGSCNQLTQLIGTTTKEPLKLSTTLTDGQAGKYQGNLAFTFAKATRP